MKQIDRKIELHGEKLNCIFNTVMDDTRLSKRFRSFEDTFRQLAESYRNGNMESEEYEKRYNRIEGRLKKLVGRGFDKIHINRDPRDYMLKLKPEYMVAFSVDEAGYGILAPNLRKEKV